MSNKVEGVSMTAGFGDVSGQGFDGESVISTSIAVDPSHVVGVVEVLSLGEAYAVSAGLGEDFSAGAAVNGVETLSAFEGVDPSALSVVFSDAPNATLVEPSSLVLLGLGAMALLGRGKATNAVRSAGQFVREGAVGAGAAIVVAFGRVRNSDALGEAAAPIPAVAPAHLSAPLQPSVAV